MADKMWHPNTNPSCCGGAKYITDERQWHNNCCGCTSRYCPECGAKLNSDGTWEPRREELHKSEEETRG